jgi:hypothetical protein
VGEGGSFKFGFFRLCFRLQEPEGEESTQKRGISSKKDVGDEWYLRYLLQAVDDPSLNGGLIYSLLLMNQDAPNVMFDLNASGQWISGARGGYGALV